MYQKADKFKLYFVSFNVSVEQCERERMMCVFVDVIFHQKILQHFKKKKLFLL